MFSIFKIFKKKKIVPHIRLSGVIGSVGKFKQGLNFSSQQEIIEKAFSIISFWLAKFKPCLNRPTEPITPDSLIWGIIFFLLKILKIENMW